MMKVIQNCLERAKRKMLLALDLKPGLSHIHALVINKTFSLLHVSLLYYIACVMLPFK